MTVDTLAKPPIAAAIATAFSHIAEGDTECKSGGLRDFFLYRDLGVAEATRGQVVAQLVKANLPPEEGTGWHFHEAKFHIVIMLKGWARFMYETEETLVKAGDCVHQRPGIRHGISGDREPRRLHDRGRRGPVPDSAADALEIGRARRHRGTAPATASPRIETAANTL